MTKTVSAAEAKAKFSEMLSRVGHGGERFIIERHGKPLAVVISIEDLQRMEMNGGLPETTNRQTEISRRFPEVTDANLDEFLDYIRTVRKQNEKHAKDGVIPEKLGFLALVGLFPELTDEDIDEMVEHIYAARDDDAGRPPVDFSSHVSR